MMLQISPNLVITLFRGKYGNSLHQYPQLLTTFTSAFLYFPRASSTISLLSQQGDESDHPRMGKNRSVVEIDGEAQAALEEVATATDLPKKAIVSRIIKLLRAAGPTARLYLLGQLSDDMLRKREMRATVLGELPGVGRKRD